MNMYGIQARNVNHAYNELFRLVRAEAMHMNSRNGPVLELPHPLHTTYERPYERVLMCQRRDANPFFHLIEAVWMMAGRNDDKLLKQIVKKMTDYSEDGTFHGAYGHRWRKHFDVDQLTFIERLLKEDPDSRRAVLTMWDPHHDLVDESPDLPCNTHVYFRLRHGVLSTTVLCRSNDLVWGAYGANAVHFSVLHEAMSSRLFAECGPLHVLSNSAHVYRDIFDSMTAPEAVDVTWYDVQDYTKLTKPKLIPTGPMEVWPEQFIEAATARDQVPDYPDRFYNSVVVPVYKSWRAHQAGAQLSAIKHANKILAADWREACLRWLERRYYCD